ncbi:MAG TPA: nucleoside diphosphate kinase regulator [Syntrophales bacterium]|nr:nucleoside diphosphate kinase regulator [Syntrophales bacterium]
MAKRTICITKPDMEKLRHLIDGVRENTARPKTDLDGLEKELDRAKVVASKKVPKDVITMNSVARLRDLASGEALTYTLVFPVDADIAQGRISVLAPIGTALIGYGVGDIIEWPVPSGTRRLKVQEVLYQPEAAGHFDR